MLQIKCLCLNSNFSCEAGVGVEVEVGVGVGVGIQSASRQSIKQSNATGHQSRAGTGWPASRRWRSLYFWDFCTFLWENLTEIKLPEHASSYDLELGLPITAIRQGIYVKIKRPQNWLQPNLAEPNKYGCSSADSQLALLTPFPGPRDSPRFCLIPARSAPDKN